MDEMYRDPTPDQLQDLHDALVDAVTRLTDGISVRYGGLTKTDPQYGTCMNTAEWQVTMLRALSEVTPLVETVADRTARTAGIMGATYTQLGEASGITRQAATKRWPGAVPPRDPSPVEVEAAGGSGRVFYDVSSGTWAWIATAANGVTRESDDAGHTTSEAAAAAVGAFLASSATEEPTR
ncbi:hypothetical protein [Streptomyces niveiscabiei]|uniref:hypothetical protein n=1 Tax=Streptomyces niveiscabiei TaxID=164115 RepID=UPI0038F7437B